MSESISVEAPEQEIRVLTPEGDSPARFLNPAAVFVHLARHWPLIVQYARRELDMRYKSTHLGFAWSLINPLMLLLVYTFVFAMVFKARWGTTPDEGFAHFAVALFAGLIAFNLLSETLGASSTLVMENAAYVKKMVFPVEILPAARVAANTFQALLNLVILIPAVIIVYQRLPITTPLIILVLLPLVVLALGLSYIIAALGAFIRDIGHSVAILILVLFFATPIFYPSANLPEPFNQFYRVNILAIIVENCRRVAVFGQWPEWGWMGLVYLISVIVLAAGFTFFQKCRKAFADVL